MPIGQLQSQLTKRLHDAWVKRQFHSVVLILVIISILLLFLFGIRAKVEQAIVAMFDKSVPTMIEWVLVAYAWPFSPIIVAFGLFILAVAIIAIINRDWSGIRSSSSQRLQDRELVGWARSIRIEDRESLQRFLGCEVVCNMSTIFSTSDPHIIFEFNCKSSAVYWLRIGKNITGQIWEEDGNRAVGDTPKKVLASDGNEKLLELWRGDSGVFKLRQPITESLRDQWIRQRSNSDEDIDVLFSLRGLHISVELLRPENNEVAATLKLTIPPIKCTGQ